jgi:hypothetical protein
MSPSMIKLYFPFLPSLFRIFLTSSGWGKQWPFLLFLFIYFGLRVGDFQLFGFSLYNYCT